MAEQATIPVKIDDIHSDELPEAYEMDHPVKVWHCGEGEWCVPNPGGEIPEPRIHVHTNTIQHVQPPGDLIVCEMVPVGEHKSDSDAPIEPYDGLDRVRFFQKTKEDLERLEARDELTKYERQKVERHEKRLDVIAGGG